MREKKPVIKPKSHRFTPEADQRILCEIAKGERFSRQMRKGSTSDENFLKRLYGDLPQWRLYRSRRGNHSKINLSAFDRIYRLWRRIIVKFQTDSGVGGMESL